MDTTLQKKNHRIMLIFMEESKKKMYLKFEKEKKKKRKREKRKKAERVVRILLH